MSDHKRNIQLILFCSFHVLVFVTSLLTFSAFARPALRLSGIVLDLTGRAIPSAEIEVSGADRTYSRHLLSSADGRFAVELPGGVYQVTVRFPGFALWKREVHGQGPVEIEVLLKPAAMSEHITVTATRNEEMARRAPQPATLILGDEIRHRQPTNITELVADLPGVYFTESGPFRQRPVMRGLDSNRLLILVDGQRLNNGRTSTQNAGIEPALVDIHQVERIEVVRGAGSVLHGSDALAGVINIITRKPEPTTGLKFSGGFSGEYQSARDGRRFHGMFGASRADWSLRLAGTIGRFENYKAPAGRVPNSAADEDNAEAAFSFSHSSRDHLRLQWTRRRGSRIGVPGLAESGPFFANFPFDDRDKIALFYQRDGAGALFARLGANFYWQKQERNFFNRVQSPGFSLSSSTITDTRTVGYDLQFTQHPRRGHRLTYGTSFFRDSNQDFREQIIFPGTPRARVIDRSPSVPNSRLTGFAIFLQDEWAASDRLSFNLGIRTDIFHTSAEATANFQGPIAGARTNATVNGNVGAMFQLSSQLSLFGRVARAFREPNLFERFFFGRGSVGGFVVPNPDLEPETAVGTEVGFRIHNDRIRLTANYFHNRISDLIATVPGTFRGQPTFGGQPVSTSANIEEARIQGIEGDLELWWSAAGQLWMFYSRHSYQRGTNLTNDQPLPLIVPFASTNGLRWYGATGKIMQELQVRTVAGGDRVPSGSPPLSGFTLLGWRSEIRLFDRNGLFAFYPGMPQLFGWSLDNFTDKSYRHLFSRIAAEGINVKLRLEWVF